MATKHVIRAEHFLGHGLVVKLGAASCYAEATARAERLLSFESEGSPTWGRVWVEKDGKRVWEKTNE